MKRSTRVLGVTVFLFTALIGVALWYSAFRAPAFNRLRLPDGLIAAESTAGQQLLTETSFIADYEILSRAFESQSRPGFCGVASSVVVLNALRGSIPPVTQSDFFTDATDKVRGSLQITFGGMTLAQLGDLLRAHGAQVTVFYTADASIETFRSVARRNLETTGDFLLVNYQRAVLGQNESGHISPVAAYNAAADRVLILDVAAYKYPPVWVSTEALWNAMNTIDPASGRRRGFAVVREADAASPRGR